MAAIFSHFVQCLRDENGQAVSEYGLLTFVFSIMMIGALSSMQQATGHNLNAMQNNLSGLYVNP
jgi:Flp pilus assembly pilin Flp